MSAVTGIHVTPSKERLGGRPVGNALKRPQGCRCSSGLVFGHGEEGTGVCLPTGQVLCSPTLHPRALQKVEGCISNTQLFLLAAKVFVSCGDLGIDQA